MKDANARMTMRSVAAKGNTALRTVIDDFEARLVALDAGVVASAPATADWALEGSRKVIPEPRISQLIARDTEVDAKIAAAIAADDAGDDTA